MQIRRPLRFTLLAMTFATLVAATSMAAYQISQRMGLAELQSTGRHRLDLYAASLDREIEKYAYFPATLGLERDVLDLLAKPKNTQLRDKLNSYLEQLNERAGTLAIYVMDDKGVVLTSSNWRRADSFCPSPVA